MLKNKSRTKSCKAKYFNKIILTFLNGPLNKKCLKCFGYINLRLVEFLLKN